MKPKKTRNMLVVGMLLTTKGGEMRDRRDRRQKEKKNAWKREEW